MKKTDLLESGSFLIKPTEERLKREEPLLNEDMLEEEEDSPAIPVRKGMRVFGWRRGVTKSPFRPRFKGSARAKRLTRIGGNYDRA